MKRGREEEEFDFGPKNTCAYKIYALLYQGRYNDAIKYAKRIKHPGYAMITLCDKNFEFSRPFMKEIGRYWQLKNYSLHSDKVNDYRIADNLIKYFGVDFILYYRDVTIRSQLIERYIYFQCTVDCYNALPPALRDEIVAFLSALIQFRLPKDLRGRLVRMQVLQYFTWETDVGHLIADTGLKTESQTLAQQLRFAVLTKNYKVICDFLQVTHKSDDDNLSAIVKKACNLRAVELYLLVDDRNLLSSFSLSLKEQMPEELFERFIARKGKVFATGNIPWTDGQLRRLVYNEMIYDVDNQRVPVIQEFHNKLRLGRELGITITLDKTYEVFKPFGDVGKHIYRWLCLRYWIEHHTFSLSFDYGLSKKTQIQLAVDKEIPISLPRPKGETYSALLSSIRSAYYFKQMWLFTE